MAKHCASSEAQTPTDRAAHTPFSSTQHPKTILENPVTTPSPLPSTRSALAAHFAVSALALGAPVAVGGWFSLRRKKH